MSYKYKYIKYKNKYLNLKKIQLGGSDTINNAIITTNTNVSDTINNTIITTNTNVSDAIITTNTNVSDTINNPIITTNTDVSDTNYNIKNKIIKYFSMLSKYLDSYCFFSGSFIIQDNNETLYNLLNNNTLNVNITTTQYTHRGFWTENYSIFNEISFIPESLIINCNNLSQEKKLVKWYRFKKCINSCKDKFIFAKLEREAESRSITHMWNYVTKKFIFAPNNEYNRREDCNKICRYNINTATDYNKPFEFYKTTSIKYENEYNIIINNEKYERLGDEMFIIEPVSEFIINCINENKEIDIKQDAIDSNNIIISKK